MATPIIGSVSFGTTTGTLKVGDQLIATILADATGYMESAITINGQAVTGFTDNNDNSYTVIYTVAEGDTDIADGAEIPVSVVMTDGSNTNDPFTTAPAPGESPAIDANSPVITSGTAADAIDENSGTAQVVYTAALVDSTGVTYSLRPLTGDVAAFSIDAGTGEVTLTDNPDFETKASYSFTIMATDAAGNTSEQAVTLSINNRNDVPVIGQSAPPSFTAKVDYAVGSGPFSISSADVNGDDHADLIVANFSSNNVSVLTNNGDGTFATRVNYATGSLSRSVSGADVNGDGHADLLVANLGGDSVSVLTNNGDGTFAATVNYATGSNPTSVANADVNGDGHTDLLVANVSSDTVSVLTNNGDGTFAAKIDYVSGSGPMSMSSADVNGDGHTDLLTGNYYGNTVSVLTNNGDGTFAAKVDYVTGSGPISVSSADINGDGHADLLVANESSNTVSVLTNNGDGTFAAKVDYAVALARGPWAAPMSIATAMPICSSRTSTTILSRY